MMEEEFNPQEHEENLYSEEGRSEFIDGGEISAEEEAFMQGYDEAEEDEDQDEEENEEEQN
jgi:hypothetical protein